jgi:hypothetical protein
VTGTSNRPVGANNGRTANGQPYSLSYSSQLLDRLDEDSAFSLSCMHFGSSSCLPLPQRNTCMAIGGLARTSQSYGCDLGRSQSCARHADRLPNCASSPLPPFGLQSPFRRSVVTQREHNKAAIDNLQDCAWVRLCCILRLLIRL